MTHDLPIPRQEDRSESTSVLEWGTEDEKTTSTSRWRSALGGLGHDHRVPLLLVGLGVAATLASLLGEWVTVTLPTGSERIELPSNVSEIGGLGVGYLVGMLMLGVSVALALRGTDNVRANARVAGLALAVGLVAVLVATAVALEDGGGRAALAYSTEDGFAVELGRGLVAAFAAVLLFAIALARTTTRPEGATSEPGRRQPRPHRQIDDTDTDEDEGGRPIDITVTPTVPFAREP
ncbi:hypothetical protein [Micromonospora maris]|uniref:Uncharacterized protein n=1 Tax=Micromonospora maris TaxID=1003110 RepID=A0A9X0LE46_9ACTN|nr:hypothetical protein [Micromonospora maris]AEB47903.1 hypothetical protein VAB18032_04105 [Micromonospora maris AB-18-032]KUJ46902.1 hypothetical protein ADL17_29085 [Micromonospora maris]